MNSDIRKSAWRLHARARLYPEVVGISPCVSSRSEITGGSDQARKLEPPRAHDLLVAQIAVEEVPCGLALDAVGDRRPARDLVGLVGLDRPPAQPQVADARADLRGRGAAVTHPADAHHVAALLVVGIGMEQVVADVLQERLDRRA